MVEAILEKWQKQKGLIDHAFVVTIGNCGAVLNTKHTLFWDDAVKGHMAKIIKYYLLLEL